MGQDALNYRTEKEYPHYVNKTEIEAMLWLKKNTSLSDVIFSSYEIGNFIPAYSGRVVWIGHGPQTIDLEKKYRVAEWFWGQNNDDDAKYDLLKNDRVTYIWYGEHEKKLGTYDPAPKYYLQKVYENHDVIIYRVK
jgi:uncharacterized membrane protein